MIIDVSVEETLAQGEMLRLWIEEKGKITLPDTTRNPYAGNYCFIYLDLWVGMVNAALQDKFLPHYRVIRGLIDR